MNLHDVWQLTLDFLPNKSISVQPVQENISDQPPRTVPVVKLLFAAPLGQPLHFVEA